jgi:6-phosphofructokinase 1
VAIPKTMDNDILWVWQSFGFMSAVEKAKEFILQLYTEASSNPRLCIMQLFGSDSGFVVSHAALASGVCDAVLIPETDFSMEVLSKHIKTKLLERYRPGNRGKSPYGMILMAETAIPRHSIDDDGCDYLDDPDVRLSEREREAIEKFISNHRRVHGQTPDALRRGGIKIISRVLEREIREMATKRSKIWEDFRVFTNEPRHLIRAINPSVQDVIFGQRLAILAVDNAMFGYTDFMISQWMTEFVLVPLKLVVLGRKRVPKNGIFWKSVLANTDQPAKMV